MTTQTTSVPQRSIKNSPVPPLEAGDELDQPTFHERYLKMPESFRAELVGGFVHVPSPLKADHGDVHGEVLAWLKFFKSKTPNTRVLDNATHILGEDSEPQPDATLLKTVNGQARSNEQGYIEGAPELAVEVSSSTESIDLNRKRLDYLKYGVQEYVIFVLREERVIWLVREGDRFVEHPADQDGYYKSPMFPGLWLDGPALFRCDTSRVFEVLAKGLASPEHAAYVARTPSPD